MKSLYLISKALVLSMLLISILSCSSDKIYPVCFYDDTTPTNAKKKEYVDSLLKYLLIKDSNAIATSDNRWIIAKVSNKEHTEISKFWPRLACIGTVSSGTELQKDAECVGYIINLLNNNTYLEFDLKENIINNDEALGSSNVICYKDPS